MGRRPQVVGAELDQEPSVHAARTDADVAEAVENVLEWTSSLPAGAIQVLVEGGWDALLPAAEPPPPRSSRHADQRGGASCSQISLRRMNQGVNGAL